MQRAVRFILLIWFGLISVFFLWTMVGLMQNVRATANSSIETPPVRPTPPAADQLPALDFTKDLKTQIEAYQSRVSRFSKQADAYKDEASAYTQQATAYSKYLDTTDKTHGVAAYLKVLGEVFIPFLNTFVTALITYAFGVVASNIAYNWFATRPGVQHAQLKDVSL